MSKFIKVLLALNIAGLIRAIRYGPWEAARRLVNSFDAISPFGGAIEASPEVLRQMATIPIVNIREIAPQSTVFRMDGRQQYVDGALPHHDLMALLALLDNWKPEAVLEIGTFNGATTATMALNAPNATIHTVDLPLDYDPAKEQAGNLLKDDFHLIAQRRVGMAYSSLPEIKNVVQHFADSANWDFAPVKETSFFFIDGAHTYEYAKNDTEKCLAIAAQHARFVFHDSDERHPDVIRYLAELVSQGVPVRKIKGTSLAYFDRA